MLSWEMGVFVEKEGVEVCEGSVRWNGERESREGGEGGEDDRGSHPSVVEAVHFTCCLMTAVL